MGHVEEVQRFNLWLKWILVGFLARKNTWFVAATSRCTEFGGWETRKMDKPTGKEEMNASTTSK